MPDLSAKWPLLAVIYGRGSEVGSEGVDNKPVSRAASKLVCNCARTVAAGSGVSMLMVVCTNMVRCGLVSSANLLDNSLIVASTNSPCLSASSKSP